MEYKEIANPFVFISIIFLAVFLTGVKGYGLIMYSFAIFFIISFLFNVFFVISKYLYPIHYLFVYIELSFSLIFLIPLFYLINIENAFFSSLSLLGFTDLIIQAFYNIRRKDGRWLAERWKNKLVRSSRIWVHPVSMQRYVFKDFTCEIIEPSKKNLTVNHLLHHLFMVSKTPENITKTKFGRKDVMVFDIEKVKVQKKDEIIDDVRINKKFLSKLSKIDKKIAKNITTCYDSHYKYCRNIARIVIDKRFVYENDEEVYEFLKKVNEKADY